MENINYHLDKHFFDEPMCFGSIRLYQLGRLHAGTDTTVDTHVHGDLYELTVVTDGAGIITTNGVPVKVNRGDIYLSFPCDTHKIESDNNKPIKFDFLAFNTDDVTIKGCFESIILEYSGAEKRLFNDERVSFLVGNAISELGGDQFGAQAVLENILNQILIYTVRSFSKEQHENTKTRSAETDLLCYRLMNYVDTHIYSMKKLEELGEVMGYSYGYLSALYKKTTSNTLSDYYKNKKLEIARLLVMGRNMKMSEIAEKLNYASVYAFSKAFKNHFGSSPENYCKIQGLNLSK